MSVPSSFAVRLANLQRHNDCRAVVELLDAYSRDPIGQNAPLSSEVREQLVHGLRAHPTSLIWLAWDGDVAVGIAVCFRGYSTFQARPLINIHDLAVHPDYRRQGIGRELLMAIESAGRELGCCRLTLEVRGDNAPAERLYREVGFQGDGCQGTGYAFWTKDLGNVDPARSGFRDSETP